MSMKNLMIEMLNLLQKQGDNTTRLHYIENREMKYVENFSPFANENYMTSDLLSALRNNKTRTSDQEKELNFFIISKVFDGDKEAAEIKVQELKDKIEVAQSLYGSHYTKMIDVNKHKWSTVRIDGKLLQVNDKDQQGAEVERDNEEPNEFVDYIVKLGERVKALEEKGSAQSVIDEIAKLLKDKGAKI